MPTRRAVTSLRSSRSPSTCAMPGRSPLGSGPSAIEHVPTGPPRAEITTQLPHDRETSACSSASLPRRLAAHGTGCNTLDLAERQVVIGADADRKDHHRDLERY